MKTNETKYKAGDVVTIKGHGIRITGTKLVDSNLYYTIETCVIAGALPEDSIIGLDELQFLPSPQPDEQPKQTVTKATVLGENCACCNHWEVHEDATISCWSDEVHRQPTWDFWKNTREHTDHPPGDSVCPAFEAME
jgi:hypothetical protein